MTFQRVKINLLKHWIRLRTPKTDPKLPIFGLKKSKSGYKWLFSEIGDAWPSKNRKFHFFLLFWPLWHLNNDFFRMQDWFRDFEALWKSLEVIPIENRLSTFPCEPIYWAWTLIFCIKTWFFKSWGFKQCCWRKGSRMRRFMKF